MVNLAISSMADTMAVLLKPLADADRPIVAKAGAAETVLSVWINGREWLVTVRTAKPFLPERAP